MAILQSLIKKEAIHIFRDRCTMLISLLMPIILLLLFGFAISTEVNNVDVVAVVDRHTDRTRDVIERLKENQYITFKGLTSADEIDYLLRRGEVDAAVVLRSENDRMETQVIVDASNTSVAQASTGYIQGIVDTGVNTGQVQTRTLYNPQLKSAYNFVPGIMGMIFILICAIMTSVSIVSEKESGTLDLLLVSPVKPGTIIMGKLIPYFILSCIILGMMLIIAYTLLDMPISVNIINVILISLIYIVLSLSIGFLVSAIVNTQLTALIVSAVAFMLPVILLSGMIFPIDNMPKILQGVSCIIPARWYTVAMRKLMVQQLGLKYIYKELMILLAMTGILLFVAVKKFNLRK